jgi:choline dehydrogenase
MATIAMEDFDYVIVGAGSAGCVMASRLSQDASARILLVEAGGEDRNPYIPIPMGIGKTLANPRLNWYYATEPDAGNAFRPRVWMRGRVLGGSSTTCFLKAPGRSESKGRRPAGRSATALGGM